MDRITHSTAIDIGGGRRGFRSKDTGAGIPGTVVTATHLNAEQEEIVGAVEKAGFVPDAGDLSQLAKVIQSGAFNWAVATGTANDWNVELALAIEAYKAGRSFRIKPPATNTTTTVKANISHVGDRRVKKSDGSDPAIGDLHVDRYLEVFDDGVNLRILSNLPSDRFSEPYLGFRGEPVTQSFANNVQARVAAYSSMENNLPGAVQAGGIITVGTSGFYAVTANMLALMPGSGGSNYFYAITVSKVDAGGVPIASIAAQPVTVTPASIAANLAGAASGIAKLGAGDKVAAFFVHNQGSAQNMSISLDIEFRGK